LILMRIFYQDPRGGALGGGFEHGQHVAGLTFPAILWRGSKAATG
jgi:hypothetical protein